MVEQLWLVLLGLCIYLPIFPTRNKKNWEQKGRYVKVKATDWQLAVGSWLNYPKMVYCSHEWNQQTFFYFGGF